MAVKLTRIIDTCEIVWCGGMHTIILKVDAKPHIAAAFIKKVEAMCNRRCDVIAYGFCTNTDVFLCVCGFEENMDKGKAVAEKLLKEIVCQSGVIYNMLFPSPKFYDF